MRVSTLAIVAPIEYTPTNRQMIACWGAGVHESNPFCNKSLKKILVKESICYCCVPFKKESETKTYLSCQQLKIKHILLVKMGVVCLLCELSCCLTSGQLLSYCSSDFPRLMMSLFSRISVFFSGCSRVFETMALTTVWIGIDMELDPKAETALKNFLASHSAGRLSCLSTNKTLKHKGTRDFREAIFSL